MLIQNNIIYSDTEKSISLESIITTPKNTKTQGLLPQIRVQTISSNIRHRLICNNDMSHRIGPICVNQCNLGDTKLLTAVSNDSKITCLRYRLQSIYQTASISNVKATQICIKCPQLNILTDEYLHEPSLPFLFIKCISL